MHLGLGCVASTSRAVAFLRGSSWSKPNMTAEQQTLADIKATIASMASEDQVAVEAFAKSLREFVSKAEPYTTIALALVGAEMAAR